MTDKDNTDNTTKIMVMLTRIETKQEGMHEDVIETRIDVKKQNGRIRKLENWRYMILGAFGLAIFVVKYVL